MQRAALVECLVQSFPSGVLSLGLVSVGAFSSKQPVLSQLFVEPNSREENARAQSFCLRNVKLPFDIFPLPTWYLFNKLPDCLWKPAVWTQEFFSVNYIR